MQFVIRQSVPGVIFTQNAFASHIGKVVPLNLRETDGGSVKGTMGIVRLIKADIIEDGRTVELTLESVEEVPKFDPPAGMSFSFT